LVFYGVKIMRFTY